MAQLEPREAAGAARRGCAEALGLPPPTPPHLLPPPLPPSNGGWGGARSGRGLHPGRVTGPAPTSGLGAWFPPRPPGTPRCHLQPCGPGVALGRVFGPALGGVLSACDRAVHWETSRSPPPPLTVSAGQRGHQGWASVPQKTSDSQLSLTMSPPPFCPQRPPPHQLNRPLRTSGRSQPLRDTPGEP